MEHLSNFSNEKLIDITKNYEMYKYDISIKRQALEILASRGINEEELLLSNNKIEATKFRIQNLYNDFRRNSYIAFSLYIALIILNFFVNSFTVFFIFLTILIAYFICLIISFINQKDFYKVINKPEKANPLIIYLVIGMPLYPFFFYFSIKRIKEHLISLGL